MLVCNGKHQYQARDDLEAFLGKRSADFVSWYVCLFPSPRPPPSSSSINQSICLSFLCVGYGVFSSIVLVNLIHRLLLLLYQIRYMLHLSLPKITMHFPPPSHWYIICIHLHFAFCILHHTTKNYIFFFNVQTKKETCIHSINKSNSKVGKPRTIIKIIISTLDFFFFFNKFICLTYVCISACIFHL